MLNHKPNPQPKPKSAPHKQQPQDETNPIISLDPTAPVNPQPLIADILRTGYCVPGSVFLVESIERNIPVSELLLPPSEEQDDAHRPASRAGSGRVGSRSRHDHRRRPMRAVRLLLGDGELCIQAFCCGEIHRFVDSGSVFEGGYVRLDKFDVRFAEVGAGDGAGEVLDDGVGDPERLVGEWERVRRKKVKGKGRVVYLVVRDMVTVGWNELYMGILRKEKEKERDKVAMKELTIKEVGGTGEWEKGEGGRQVSQAEDYDDEEGEEVLQQLMEKDPGPAAAPLTEQTAKVATINSLPAQPNQPPEEDIDDPDYISDSDSAFETLTVSAERATQRRVHVATATADPRQQIQAAIIQQNQENQQPPPQQHHPPPMITRPRPWLPTTATQPLKLTPLASIPHLPYRQNWMINVLAIVVSLSAVEPSHIAPSFRQRTARLADMSTPKHILLTVYLDPEEFLPEVGSVVLLLGVKNHLFEGGSLRKYVSDRLVGGGRWWAQRVDELGWCHGDVGRLRAWWQAGGGGRGG